MSPSSSSSSSRRRRPTTTTNHYYYRQKRRTKGQQRRQRRFLDIVFGLVVTLSLLILVYRTSMIETANDDAKQQQQQQQITNDSHQQQQQEKEKNNSSNNNKKNNNKKKTKKGGDFFIPDKPQISHRNNNNNNKNHDNIDNREPRTDPDGSTHELKPLQSKAAWAQDRKPEKYIKKEYHVPKEDEIPFVDPDFYPSTVKLVEEYVTQRPDLYRGREQLLGMLLEMNLNVSDVEEDVWKEVPMWEDIQKVHGKHPIVHGLDEQCQEFRDSVPATERHLAIAGLFSSGTNLVSQLLQHNCGIPERVDKLGRRRGHGMEWQVPYGKHTPLFLVKPEFRVKGRRSNIKNIHPDDCLVALAVRHPYDWIASMCRHGYTAKWDHTRNNCPNLVGDGLKNTTVRARFGAGITYFDSIAHMWNDWNGAYYYNATARPNIMLRFEDIVFYPKQLTRLLCACVGGQLYEPKDNHKPEEHNALFHYVINSAVVGPGHGRAYRNGLVDAWIKYGKRRDLDQFSSRDLEFMSRTFDKTIMNSLGWDGPE